MTDPLSAKPPLDARILVIDDDPNCVRGLMHLLEGEGYTLCVGFSDPKLACEQFLQIRPDLVVMDWHMEAFSGRKVLEAFNEQLPRDEMPPVIVMTGDTFPETRQAALEAGASDFLLKPLERLDVVVRIRNHLRLRVLHQHVQTENSRLEEVVLSRTAELSAKVAELKTMQQQIIAEERMRALSVMAGGVAHDFNNALTVISGYSELYSTREPSRSSHAEMRKGFEIIALAAHDAGEIVRRLREFYRPFDNKGDERQLLDLNKLVSESLELACPKWKTECQAKGISVTMDTYLETVADISGAPAEIREVLLNLIFNAVDAMPQGGQIIIRTRQEDAEVVLEVEDSGTGMTPETQIRCLEPFYSTKGVRGTGLGLAITYGIIQRHGGTIRIRSELNKGTCFRVGLPLPLPGLPEALAAIVALPIQQHLRVLVVDDDPIVSELLSRYLEEDQHSVTTAATGCEALEKFNAGEFDLVITDRVMPKMSGDQLAIAIRDQKPAKPIILITGFEGVTAPVEADLLVSKPATIATLRNAISRAMGARQA